MHREPAVHLLGQRARDGETDARALDVGVLGPEAVEGLEEAGKGLGGDARSGIGDGQADPSSTTITSMGR